MCTALAAAAAAAVMHDYSFHLARPIRVGWRVAILTPLSLRPSRISAVESTAKQGNAKQDEASVRHSRRGTLGQPLHLPRIVTLAALFRTHSAITLPTTRSDDLLPCSS